MKRPSLISRPTSISSRNNDAASISNSSLSSALSRPSLLTNIRQEVMQESSLATTPWKVVDTSLKPVPAFYPPLDPRCSTIVTDSSPSMVASRISDCLKTRSISVEYDAETITATCMTVDRVHFSIRLYRGNRMTLANPDSLDQFPDLSHAVIIEVMRTRGSTLSFHSHNRAILNAARGLSVGRDAREPMRTSPLEYPRLKRNSMNSMDERAAKRNACQAMPRALEHAFALLHKDRLDTQRLGMESLVHLTDCYSSGTDLAIHASMTVVGSPIMLGDDVQSDSSTAEGIHRFLVTLLKDRVLPGDEKEEPLTVTTDSSNSGVGDDSASEKSETSNSLIIVDDAHHGGLLRSMAMRVLANALTVLSEHHSTLLTNILKTSVLTSRDFVQVLAEDLLGASRLPAVVAGTRLASVHEAALATRCIAILAQHSPHVQHLLANPKATTQATLELLAKNQEVVRHEVLVSETKLAYQALTQEFRTC